MIALPGIGPVPLDGFSHPALLAVAAAPMALVVGYVLVQSQLRRRTERFADPALLSTVSPRRAHPLRHLPIALAVIGLLLLTVAVAGPSRDIRVPRNRAVIMLVIDVSQSMRATDVAPTRLAAAQDAARHFAESLTPGVNLGLVAFAGHPNLLVSPTPDHQATIAALANLKPDDSTATGDAIFDGRRGSQQRPEDRAAGANRVAFRRRREQADQPRRPARLLHCGTDSQDGGGARIDDLDRHQGRVRGDGRGVRSGAGRGHRDETDRRTVGRAHLHRR
jgi:Ca-activated chloride channel family protein